VPSPTVAIELLGLGLFFISTSMIAWKGWQDTGAG
jgi:hypothetical protein